MNSSVIDTLLIALFVFGFLAIDRFLFLASSAIGVTFLIRAALVTRRIPARLSVPLVLYLTFMLLSIITLAPDLGYYTTMRSVLTIGQLIVTIAGGVTIIGMLGMRRFMIGAAVACGAMAAINVVVVGIQGLTVVEADNVWWGFASKGWYGHKNTLGFICIITFALSYFGLERSNPWRIPLSGIALGLAYVSSSKSAAISIVIALIGTAILIVISRTRSPISRVVSVSAIVAMVAFAAVLSLRIVPLDTIVGWLFQDITLTGRVGMWDAAVDLISQKPLLGWGIYSANSAFAGPETPFAYIAERVWTAFHVHNGYVEAAIELGLIGLLLSTIALMIYPATRATRDVNLYGARVVLFLIIAAVFAGMTESSLAPFSYFPIRLEAGGSMLLVAQIVACGLSCRHVQNTTKRARAS